MFRLLQIRHSYTFCNYNFIEQWNIVFMLIIALLLKNYRYNSNMISWIQQFRFIIFEKFLYFVDDNIGHVCLFCICSNWSSKNSWLWSRKWCFARVYEKWPNTLRNGPLLSPFYNIATLLLHGIIKSKIQSMY